MFTQKLLDFSLPACVLTHTHTHFKTRTVDKRYKNNWIRQTIKVRQTKICPYIKKEDHDMSCV